MTSNASQIRKEIRALADPAIAASSMRFFKTGKGQYGEGDRFLGIRVPVIRKLVVAHKMTPLHVILEVLTSKYHEERMFAVLSLVDRYKRGNEDVRATVYRHYLDNLGFVNNWDLVDCSAHHIVAPEIQDCSRKPLYQLAKSEDLWRRRVAIMATFHFIRQHDYGDTLALAALLIDDSADLIHKAVGWMLREVGNRDKQVLCAFLRENYRTMPRTMLRYAIEKFPEAERKDYLNGRID